MAVPRSYVIPRKPVNTQGYSPVASQTQGIDATVQEKPPNIKNASPTKVDWRVPTVMASSLFLGGVSAVGHHVLYAHYDGQIANDLTKQRYIINAGTGLAFLVKMFLAIATGTAYVQQFWLSVKHEPKSFAAIDTLYSVLGNAILFWNLKLWFRNLTLAGLAVITWYVSIHP
jgi:hypothetical protein